MIEINALISKQISEGPILILERLEDYILSSRKERNRKCFSASQLYDLCPRYEALKEKYPVEHEQPDAKRFKTYNHGSIIHDMIQNQWLGPAGLLIGGWSNAVGAEVVGKQPGPEWKYVEPEMVDYLFGGTEEEWSIMGHCDGILINGHVLEIKSVTDNIFKGLKLAYERVQSFAENYISCGENVSGYPASYARKQPSQARLYAELLIKKGINITGITMMYYNKNTEDIATYEVTLDSSAYKVSVEKITHLLEFKKTNVLPPKVCQNRLCNKAMNCQLGNHCFSLE